VKPFSEFSLALSRDPKGPLPTVDRGLVQLDESGVLKAIERCVYLSGVQLPDMADYLLELIVKLHPMFGVRA
jgi:hypothetical protein